MSYHPRNGLEVIEGQGNRGLPLRLARLAFKSETNSIYGL